MVMSGEVIPVANSVHHRKKTKDLSAKWDHSGMRLVVADGMRVVSC